MGTRTIEMTWRCGTCQHRNLGRHKTCVECGKAKSGEAFEMPADPSKAVTVTDAALLRMASAGPDWRCAYCHADQRKSDGSCQSCGASAVDALPATADVPDRPDDLWSGSTGSRTTWLIAGGAVAILIAVVVGLHFSGPKRNANVKVQAIAWQQIIEVERYAQRDGEGFREQMPDNASDVVSLGQRVHHQEQVFDHEETEHYSEQVPDGTTTEHYTESVACGETCSTTRRSCHQECTSNHNGFADCEQVCTGGDRECHPKTCDKSRTREIPRTRTELKTRQVPRYRQEPRYAEAFHWKAWTWAAERSATASGTTTALRWPEAEAHVGQGLAADEQERARRLASYLVTVREDGHDIRFAVKDADELARYPLGSAHKLHRDGAWLTLDGLPITPVVNAPPDAAGSATLPP